MNEPEFERELEALYAEQQPFSDEANFASSVERRMRLSGIRRAAVLSVCAAAGAALTLLSLAVTGWLAPLQDMLSLAYGNGTGDSYWVFIAAASLLIPPLLRSLIDTDR